MTNGRVTFYLNGQHTTIDDPKPDLLLIDYLRSPEVGLIGAKKGCGEGGCGACTVILSNWDPAADRVEHRSINSCLRPVCALGGMAVTTVEGTGRALVPPPPFPSQATTFARAAAPSALNAPGFRAARMNARHVRSQFLKVVAPVPGAAGTLAALTAERPTDGMNPVAYRLATNKPARVR